MEVFSNIALGFGVAATFQNILYCALGALLGTVVGVLPGIGPVTTVAMLLPISFTLEPTSALIMMAGIYYGAQYGGSTTAILINIPGEASSVITSLDGHKMARMGRAGPALGIAALGSFFAGCVATFVVSFGAPPLARMALQFGPAEYFSLMLCGLIAAIVLARGSIIKAIAMVVLGLLFGLAGSDVNSGIRRFTFGFQGLADGIEFVALSMAVYGIAEVAINLERKAGDVGVVGQVGRVFPSWADIRHCIPSVLRGTSLGSVLGVLPGGGALLASFAAYTLEKKVASHPRTFGEGDIRGVAAPESANNAGAQTSFIPMLTLGIPSNPTMALMIGALMVHGITPGPRVMTDRPDLFWGVVASMWIGNLMLVVLNLPMIGLWIRLVRMPYRMMFPAIVGFCCIGTYTINSNVTDVAVMAFFVVFGYLCLKLDCEPAPLILGFVLGPMMEEYLRRALLISRGDPMVFLSSPISVGFLVASALLLLVVAMPMIRARREEALAE
ncbi:MAG: tripartite tricarboxylate transporter permease [Beijerinckiaceae bacterium]|nr:tripartite tricarboxylate transporter permease [Beijerinckiaceae bacterium]MDO9441615.1 tripartite tricarboxylate transporter permease [Beijerinckiaceae bacterium]